MHLVLRALHGGLGVARRVLGTLGGLLFGETVAQVLELLLELLLLLEQVLHGLVARLVHVEAFFGRAAEGLLGALHGLVRGLAR